MMSDRQKIAEYIENLSFKKSVFGKVSTNDVKEVICEISDMYNEMLSNVYKENERLKRLIDDMDETPQTEKTEESVGALNVNKNSQSESSETMFENNEYKQAVEQDDVSSNTLDETGLIDKDLRKFKRTELLEVLLEQSRENESQKKEIEELKRTILSLKGKLDDRTIRLEKAGTIAEAAFVLNGVYDSAQEAAQQYLDSLELLYEREYKNCIEKESRTEAYVKMRLEEVDNACALKEKRMADRCAALEQATRERCEAMKEDVVQRCIDIEERTRAKCELREQEAEKKCRELDQKAQMDVEKRWDVLSKRLEEFYFTHDGVRERLSMTGDNQSE